MKVSEKRQKNGSPARLKRLASLSAFVILIAAICLLFLDSTLKAAPEMVALGSPTYVSGVIDTDTNWTIADSPYLVTGDLTVSEGVTLTIEPGVEVRFATTDDQSSGEDSDKVELIVAGTLVADGVTLNSNAGSPAAGGWYGIRFLDSSVDYGDSGCIIENSVIENGTVGISIDAASPMISNNTIASMKGDDGEGQEDAEDGYGIYMTNGSAPIVNHNFIYDVKGGEAHSWCPGWPLTLDGGNAYGIYVVSGSFPVITNNTVSNIFGGKGGFWAQPYPCAGKGGLGVGINVASSTPMISDNLISTIGGGHSYMVGGVDGIGVYLDSSSAVIENNSIISIIGGLSARSSNSGGLGAGILLRASLATIENNSIHGIYGGGGRPGGIGAGIFTDSESSARPSRNMISDIKGGDGEDAYCWNQYGCGIAGDGGLGAGIYAADNSALTADANILSLIAAGNGGDGTRTGEIWCDDTQLPLGGDGGLGVGIYGTGGSPLDIVNSIVFEVEGGDGGKGGRSSIEEPSGSGGDGGLGVGIRVAGSLGTLMNNTIVASAGGQGGAPGDSNNLTVDRVRNSTDDAQEFANGDYNDDGPGVLLGDDSGIQNYVGLRFSEWIPQGAVIDSAELTVTAYESSSVSSTNGTQFLIKGEAIGDSPTFSVDNSPRDRSPTVAGVTWMVTEDWVQGQAYSRPDLSGVIQEIVNREDWPFGSALTILVLDVEADNRSRRASTWDKDPEEAAELAIAWHWPEEVSGTRGEDGKGIGIDVNSSADIVNNIVVSHTIGISGTATAAALSHNDVWANSDANYSGVAPGSNDISANPLFVDPANNDYHLRCGSPAIDAGTNEGAPPTDFEGDPRPLDGNSDGMAVVDMGADEFKPPTIPVGGFIVRVSKLELLATWICLDLLALVAGISLVRRHVLEQG